MWYSSQPLDNSLYDLLADVTCACLNYYFNLEIPVKPSANGVENEITNSPEPHL